MINKDSVLPMDKICRSCMTEGPEMRSLYEMTPESVQFADMMMACTTVQCASGDGLPSQICSKCEDQLNTAYTFKQQCERTDTALREYTTQPSEIKEESLHIVVKPDIENFDMFEDDNRFSDSEGAHSNYSTKVRKKKKVKSTGKQKNRQCRYCDKVLTTKEGLKLHERRHTGEKLKQCPICNASFAKTNHLVRHMSSHNKPPDEYKHTCQECGMGFTRAYHLSKHVKEEHSEKVVEQLPEPLADVKTEVVEAEDMELTTEQPEIPKLRVKKEPTEDKLHPCKVCLKAFTKSSHLARHMQTHAGLADKADKADGPKEKKYMACEFCDRKFVYKKSFLHHIQMEHQISEDSDTPLSEFATIITKTDGSEDISATHDGVAEAGVQGLNADEVGAAGGGGAADDGSKVHACHVCNHKFTRANHLTRHMTLHRAVLVHKCERCEKAFVTAEHLATHVQEYHVERPYVCSVCDKPFSRGEHLIRHLKVHDKEQLANAGGPEQAGEVVPQLKCSICDKVFARAEQLARHTKVHLAQDKRHVCTECGKAFNRLDNLRTHQRVHTGLRDPQRLHLCIYCGKEFNNSSNMIVHMRRHTGERPYKCAQCGKGFPRSHDLKCHERTHSGEKPYLCTLCGKSFNKSNKLLRHTRVHTGERPYVCTLCGRAFTQSNDLALHMRRHTGSRPYACGMCPARFIQSGQLKAHRRSQGHWLETQPELKGGHRVAPVTPLANPPPIKFKSRTLHKIKEEQDALVPQIILGHAAVGMGAGSQHDGHIVIDDRKILERSFPGPPAALLAAFTSAADKLKMEEFAVANLSREAVQATIENAHIEHRPQQQQPSAPPTNAASYQPPPPPSAEPSTSFALNTFQVSEGYTYQTYG